MPRTRSQRLLFYVSLWQKECPLQRPLAPFFAQLIALRRRFKAAGFGTAMFETAMFETALFRTARLGRHA